MGDGVEKTGPKWVTAKTVLGILAIVLPVFILFQSCAAGIGNALTDNGEIGGSMGVVVALNLLISGITLVVARNSVKKAPMIVCTVFLWVNYFYAKMFSGSYSDLVIWGFLSYALGVFCLFSAMSTKKQYIVVGLIAAVYLAVALI